MRRLWRSMPLRLALVLVVLFGTVSLLSLAASYAFTRAAFEQSIRDNLAQDLAGFRAAPSARAVALLVQAESEDTDPGRLVLSYVTRTGQIYGNGAVARDDEGFHIISLKEGRAQLDGEYLALSARLYGGRLTIARSRAEIEALQPVFFNILWISLLPTVLIALSGGLILARRSQRHVEVISKALERMTGGDLAARVVTGPRWSDDLLHIGETVNGMADAQERSVTALRQVSSDIAHDLKTPVQRVSLQLEALGEVVPAGEAAELVAQTRAEVDGISAVFRSLLQLAQMENGALRAQFAPVDLADLCRTMAEVYEASTAERQQTLTVDVPDTVKVHGEKNLLGQMIANLLENAVRHSGEGAAISVTVIQSENEVVLSVSDNGFGIPESEWTKVTQRLYRLDRSRNTPGNGLGLSLVDGVARLHGARLSLENAQPGLRAVVRFSRGTGATAKPSGT
ncbi:HAMP domain-containing sensor histidine kinase [Sulfitobacter sp. F26169L]|uniref:sensor histidine kinase n=1 Tax=Sulfitobacter sp. F26169L TaxID=2996015 RepID=UPI002260A9F1|nr:HAMP domain-containing sensor histidine kinase [Sulfitobacter sp. F26169L]MCX7566878.1 HAMP domain-containing sensor histidine kinase [Sulfitobacter sp. F26169L]